VLERATLNHLTPVSTY